MTKKKPNPGTRVQGQKPAGEKKIQRKSPLSSSASDGMVYISGQPVSEWALLGACLVLTFFVFANTFWAGFVNWDDHGYLWENKLIQPLSLGAIRNMFTDHICGAYSPMTALTYSIEHMFDTGTAVAGDPYHGFQPFLYHFDNVLLHLGTTALVFIFLRDLGIRGWGLAFATILFGIHPMRVESVAWVTERKDVLYGLFYVAALITYWRYLNNDRKPLLLGLTFLLGMFSYFSKIQAVLLPLSMFTLDYLAGRNLLKPAVWLEKLPFLAMSLLIGWVGIHYLGVASGFEDTGYPFWSRILFGTYSLVMYALRLVFPIGLSTYYPYPALNNGVVDMPAFYYATPLLVLAAAFFVLRALRSNRILVFGIGFFFLNIVLLLQIKGAGKAFMADRFTYIPYLGFFFLLGYYYNKMAEGALLPSLRKALPIVALAFVGICGILTILQNNTWKDSLSLWDNVTKQYPNDALSWTNKGDAYITLKDFANASKTYEEAIKVNPGYHDAQFNLATVYFNSKDYANAIKWFTSAIQVYESTGKPDPDAYYNRGTAYINLKEFDKGFADYQKAQQQGTKMAPEIIHRDLGDAYNGLKQYDRALAEYDESLKYKKDPNIYYLKGNAYASGLGQFEKAIEQYDQALLLKPEYLDAVNNKANSLAMLGRAKEAIPMFDLAIKLNPNGANYYNNRGLAKNTVGDRAGACEDWRKALSMGFTQAQQLLDQNCK